MKLYFLIVFFIQISLNCAQDLVIQGKLKVSDEIATMLKNLADQTQVLSSNIVNPRVSDNDTIPRTVHEVFNMTKFATDFKSRLCVSGGHGLKKLCRTIKTLLNITADVSRTFLSKTDEYYARMKKYFEFVDGKTVTNELDRDFLLLDMVESTNQLLFSIGKAMVKSMMAEYSYNKKLVDFEMLMDRIKRTTDAEKMKQLEYICQNVDVCRNFPAYSDFVAEMIKELLKLSNVKLENIVKIAVNAIKRNAAFFNSVMRENVARTIGLRLELMSEDIQDLREMLSTTQSVITNRFRLYKADVDEIPYKKKAVRIMIDIIDRAYESMGSDILAIDFDNRVKAFKHFGVGLRKNVSDVIKDLFKNFVEILKYKFNEEVKEEVRVLTDVIATGSSDNTAMYKSLMTDGSKFVTEDQLLSDLDML